MNQWLERRLSGKCSDELTARDWGLLRFVAQSFRCAGIYRSGTATILGEVNTGEGPSDIVFTEDGRKAWVSNETSGNVSLIDAEHRQKIRDIPVGKVPQGMALTSENRSLLVTNFGSNSLSVIDTSNAQAIADIPVCEGPVDVAASVRGGRALGYVSCFKAGSGAVIDIALKQEIERISFGEKPFAIASVPGSDHIYVCVGDWRTQHAGKPFWDTARVNSSDLS